MKQKTHRIPSGGYLSLEDSSILHGDLIDIKSSNKCRRDMKQEIRRNNTIERNHPKLSEIRKSLVDIAIVVYVTKNRFKKQDLDNVAKVVLDSITKKDENDEDYFIENDNQVVRLLLYKKERMEDEEANTSQLSLSIRVHNPSKEMVLVNDAGPFSEEEFNEMNKN